MIDALLGENDSGKVLPMLLSIRKMLASCEEVKGGKMNEKVLVKLKELLTADSVEIVLEAIWILANLSAVGEEYMEIIRRLGIDAAVLSIFVRGDCRTKEQVLCCIGRSVCGCWETWRPMM